MLRNQTFIDTHSDYLVNSMPEKFSAIYASCTIKPKCDTLIQINELNSQGIFLVPEIDLHTINDMELIEHLITTQNIKAVRLTNEVIMHEDGKTTALLTALSNEKIVVEVEFDRQLYRHIYQLIFSWPKISFSITPPPFDEQTNSLSFCESLVLLQDLAQLHNTFVKIPRVRSKEQETSTHMFTYYSSLLISRFSAPRCMFASYGEIKTPYSSRQWKALRQIISIEQFQYLKWKTANKVYGLGLPCQQS